MAVPWIKKECCMDLCEEEAVRQTMADNMAYCERHYQSIYLGRGQKGESSPMVKDVQRLKLGNLATCW